MNPFDEFLKSEGWLRFRPQYKGKKCIDIEDYENYNISTFGPLEYRWKNERFNFWIYWGLYIKDHPPKYFVIRTGDITDYFEPTKENYFKLIL